MIAAMLALLMCGCGDASDPVPTPPQPVLAEYLTTSDEYLNNRFFRLDLPHSGGTPGLDVPGREAPRQRIVLSSIRIFRMVSSGPLEPGDIANIAAYSDSTGVFWALPYSPPNDFLTPVVHGPRWRDLTPFDIMQDTNGDFEGVDVRVEMNADDVLAVTYVVIDEHRGIAYRVGDEPGVDEFRRVNLPGESGLYYRMKLLKAPEGVDANTFRYVMRNIYSLGSMNIDYDSFSLAIERIDFSATPERDESGIPYIQLFGLDVTDADGFLAPDGMVDLNSISFDLNKGLVRFPMEAPFNAGEAAYRSNALQSPFRWDRTFLKIYQAPGLYHPGVRASEYPNFGHFRLRVRYRTGPAGH
ncbi:MAG: hypothetical protein IPJ24_04880 [bacterium]|nr:hypothetical protein [bacterium]